MSDTLKADLAKIEEAASRIRMSQSYLRKLPPGTPGIYRFGKSVRYHLGELMAALQERSGSK